MYVRMKVCMYIYACMYIHKTSMNAYIHAHYTHIHWQIPAGYQTLCINIYAYEYTHKYHQTCLSVDQRCMENYVLCVCMCVCACIYIYTHTCIHTHAYMHFHW